MNLVRNRAIVTTKTLLQTVCNDKQQRSRPYLQNVEDEQPNFSEEEVLRAAGS